MLPFFLSQASTLLRLADREDHLYLLNHFLRCPAGVGKWAASCIQMIEPPALDAHASAVLGHPLLDHYLSMLHMTLIPVRLVVWRACSSSAFMVYVTCSQST